MDNEYIESEPIRIEQPNKLTIFQQEKASIDVQVATAKMYPRNIRRSTDNAIALVTMSQEIAASCTYSVPRKGKPIKGPSVHLAKIIAQNWGNLRMQNKVVDIDLKHVTSQAMCWDLETNIAIQTEVKRLIIGRDGRFSDDMITVTGNAANSISLRNAIFAVIPKQVTDKVYNAALDSIAGDVSDETKLKARRRQVVDGLRDTYNVTETEVLSAVGRVSLEHVDKEDIVVLIGIGTAIKDGDTTIDEAFRGKKVVQKTEESVKMDRLILLINAAKTTVELEKHKKHINSPELSKLYDEKWAELIRK